MDIDDFLKQSVGQTEFDMKDAYWQSASALLDRHYRKRMWIRRGIYISVFLLLLASGGVIWQLQRQASAPDKSLKPAQNMGIQGDIARNTLESGEMNNRDSQTQSTKSHEDYTPASLNRAGWAANDKENAVSSANQDIVNKVSREENIRSLREKNSANFGTFDTPGVSEKAEINALNGQNGEVVVYADDVLVIENSRSKSDVIEPAGETLNSINNAPINPVNANALASEVLSSISVSVNELDYPAVNIEESLPKRVDPSKFNPYWEYMVFAQMLTFPKPEPSSKKVLGGQAGVEFRYSFHKHWFLRSGLAAGVRNGSFAPSVYSTQRTYFLGPQDDAYVTRPTSLWYLGTPLQLGYRKGRNAIMAGITPQWLMGVYGNLEYARENLRQPVSDEDLYAFEKLESGWMSRGGMRRMIMTYTLSVSRQVHPRVHLGLTLQAIPSDWVSDQYGQKYDFSTQSYQPAEFDQRPLVEKNWILSFNVHYRL